MQCQHSMYLSERKIIFYYLYSLLVQILQTAIGFSLKEIAGL
ncbi:hypothetical protein A1OE_1021 [Candidatus Endolissoclinum faulkneri L2]|uniref:Uncharacterized protein n=1 Tax=Candidatus Endolissoclinum faulkneri L2 TaxID=1193729 RepID=K7YHX8_9PROT|nr:hypothetical protein A1OE_1021 [Candidatus Endolissoclinum faulkneri L2]